MASVPRQSKYPMLPMDQAITLVLDHAAALPPEVVPLESCRGRILAQPVTAEHPQPPFPASIKDGYAVVAADGTGTFHLAGEVTAGVEPSFSVTPGSVAYVTTGAPVPPGADAVVQVEWTAAGDADGAVEIKRAVAPGNDIRPVGCDVAVGQLVLEKGEELGAAEVGILASCGVTEVAVHPRPKVAVISTGDELVDMKLATSMSLRYGQIYDSNRPMLCQAVEAGGGLALDMGIAPDTLQGVSALFDKALQSADIVLTSGGISMGNKDLVKAEIEKRGTVHFGRVLMKPGKPLTFATTNEEGRQSRLLIAVPGNPVSSYVCFHLVVASAIRKLAGRSQPRPAVVEAELSSPLKLDPERPEFHRATISWNMEKHRFVAQSTGKQASSRLLSVRSANALLSLPASDETLPAGRVVEAMVIGPL